MAGLPRSGISGGTVGSGTLAGLAATQNDIMAHFEKSTHKLEGHLESAGQSAEVAVAASRAAKARAEEASKAAVLAVAEAELSAKAAETAEFRAKAAAQQIEQVRSGLETLRVDAAILQPLN